MLSLIKSVVLPSQGEPVIPSLSLWEKFLLRSNGGGAGWHPVAYGGAVFVHTFLTPLTRGFTVIRYSYASTFGGGGEFTSRRGLNCAQRTLSSAIAGALPKGERMVALVHL